VAGRMRAAGIRYMPKPRRLRERKGTVRPASPRNHADEVAQLLFYEDLKDVVLVGASSGGMVSCRFAS